MYDVDNSDKVLLLWKTMCKAYSHDTYSANNIFASLFFYWRVHLNSPRQSTAGSATNSLQTAMNVESPQTAR